MQERHRDTGVAKGHEDDSGLGACVVQGKNERGGTVQPEEEMGQGNLINV